MDGLCLICSFSQHALAITMQGRCQTALRASGVDCVQICFAVTSPENLYTLDACYYVNTMQGRQANTSWSVDPCNYSIKEKQLQPPVVDLWLPLCFAELALAIFLLLLLLLEKLALVLNA